MCDGMERRHQQELQELRESYEGQRCFYAVVFSVMTVDLSGYENCTKVGNVISQLFLLRPLIACMFIIHTRVNSLSVSLNLPTLCWDHKGLPEKNFWQWLEWFEWDFLRFRCHFCCPVSTVQYNRECINAVSIVCCTEP